jgi:acyl-CoA synthetase (AMP-forming)/AMP-acid ligase II
MLQWACARIGAILATMNPAYRTSELVNAIKLAGVQHLIVVPRIRSSAYLEMLATELPSLKSAPQGDIQDPAVPDLKNIVVVDNEGAFKTELDKLDMRCTIDWREVLLWREDTHEQKLVDEIASSLHKDDVINLQFTRYCSPSSIGEKVYSDTR